jgi:uncharacterized protein
MPGLWRRLKQLEKELLSLSEETMLIEELDGFIAGLLVCPDLIKPSEWLPIIWGGDSGDQHAAFDNLKHVNQVLGLIMDHYNGIGRTLMERADRYSPMLPVDEGNGDILWELWIEGFAKAVELHPAAWQRLLDSDADTAAAMRGMLTLVDVACGDQRGPWRDDALTATAPDNIARWIVALNAWRLANDRPMQHTAPTPPPSFSSAQKIGRNDPCPCGSGKKYKKCCGLH